MRLHFRNYRPTDRESCIALFRTNVPRYFCDHELDEFQSFLEPSDCPYFVIEADTAVLGCGGYGIRPGSDTADLCWGMVDANRHRQGVGEFLLLGRLSRILKETDAIAVRLGTSQLTDGFFHRYGFTTQSQTTDGIAQGLDDVEMRLILTDEIREFIDRRWLGLND